MTLGEIGNIIELVKGKKVAIVCGVGIQKYSDGADVLRSIDAFAVALGLFGKEGCGVAYLGDSKEGITSPFETKAKRVSRVNTKFEDFKTVFVQGANPLSQMPNTLHVEMTMTKVQNLIYFGLYENETSEIADLIIPAVSFLSKNDIRTSYSHNSMMNMPTCKKSNVGISEYDLSVYLCKAFDIKIESEEFYINHFKNHSVSKMDAILHVESREDIPYQNGFDTDDGEFLFLEEYDNDFNMDDKLFLITPKSKKSLNSQFKRESNVYLNSSLGYKNYELIRISSISGEVELKVKNNDSVREDCVLIYNGTEGVNNLTTSKHSLDGKCAIYQENKVEIIKLKG